MLEPVKVVGAAADAVDGQVTALGIGIKEYVPAVGCGAGHLPHHATDDCGGIRRCLDCPFDIGRRGRLHVQEGITGDSRKRECGCGD